MLIKIGTQWVNPEHVTHIAPSGANTVIYTTSGGRFLVDGRVDDVAERLNAHG